jgi:copper chaperone
METRNLTLEIKGMSCGHCLNAVNQALRGLAGVTVDSVRIGGAEVRFDASMVTPDRITAAVEDAGYDATIVAASHG